MRVRVRVRVSECGRKIRNANHMPKSDDRTESNLRRGRRKVGGRQGDKEEERGSGERRGRGEGGGAGFDLKNQGLGFAPDRKKPCYRKSNSS